MFSSNWIWKLTCCPKTKSFLLLVAYILTKMVIRKSLCFFTTIYLYNIWHYGTDCTLITDDSWESIELTPKWWPTSSNSIYEVVESVYGLSILMLWVLLGFCQKWFLMVFNLELIAENPGSESISFTAVRPSSMLTTWDIIGLRVGDALVHKRATFSITIASSVVYSEPKPGSTNSNRLPLSCRT